MNNSLLGLYEHIDIASIGFNHMHLIGSQVLNTIFPGVYDTAYSVLAMHAQSACQMLNFN